MQWFLVIYKNISEYINNQFLSDQNFTLGTFKNSAFFTYYTFICFVI